MEFEIADYCINDIFIVHDDLCSFTVGMFILNF